MGFRRLYFGESNKWLEDNCDTVAIIRKRELTNSPESEPGGCLSSSR